MSRTSWSLIRAGREELPSRRSWRTTKALPLTDVPVVIGSALKALEAARAGTFDGSAVAPIVELVETMDRFREPERDLRGPFMMPIEGVITVPGRGTVVTGRIRRGTLEKGARVEVVGRRDATARELVVTDMESFRQAIPQAVAGQNVGLLLRGVAKDEVERGQVLVAPGSVKPHAGGEAELYLLTKEEGGRHTPFYDGYMPQFFFGGSHVTGTLSLPDCNMAMPGDRVRVAFSLARALGVEPGMRFSLREAGRTIGAGVITSVAD